jgi:polyribonucleotide nucleotidyltransferase
MFNKVPVRHTTNFYGVDLSLETGLLAMQANAAVLATHGETSLLAAIVVGKEMDVDFLPLQVVYEERLYAVGKIKGSRFMKREGRPTDNAILTGRLIDRSLRSLFDETIRNDIQIIITVLSLDEVNPPDTLAVLAASAATMLAGVPGFKGPVSAVRVGLDNDNRVLTAPNYKDLALSKLDLVVGGNGSTVAMLEAGANIVSEDSFGAALDAASTALNLLTTFQNEFLSKASVYQKLPSLKQHSFHALSKSIWSALSPIYENIMYGSEDKLSKEKSVKMMDDSIKAHLQSLIDNTEKTMPNEGVKVLHQLLVSNNIDSENAKLILRDVSICHDIMMKELVASNALNNKRRIDGRRLDETRELMVQIDVLPRVHGSSLFSRGETQVVNVLTLGTKRDALLMDDMENFEEETKRYIHHYNFPAYSVGETGRYTGPGRREIGHGALAERALLPVLPAEEKFPYTMRLVSECFGSNGSSSMASTCASSLTLMAGGVPIKALVAGVAMGLVLDNTGKFELLTDIQGAEDHYGDMDFKVTGTDEGITAIQLDNKAAGLTVDILKQAIIRSKAARMHILEAMKEVINKPATTLSTHAPRVASFSIPSDRIGDVIGPSGKFIKAITAETGCDIEIEDSGRVLIYGKTAEMVTDAMNRIKSIVKEYEVGETITGNIFRIEEYGAFVRIDGGDKEGMIHISRMATSRVDRVEDVVKMDDHVTAYVSEVNERGQIGLSLVPLDQLQQRPQRPAGHDNFRRGH